MPQRPDECRSDRRFGAARSVARAGRYVRASVEGTDIASEGGPIYSFRVGVSPARLSAPLLPSGRLVRHRRPEREPSDAYRRVLGSAFVHRPFPGSLHRPRRWFARGLSPQGCTRRGRRTRLALCTPRLCHSKHHRSKSPLGSKRSLPGQHHHRLGMGFRRIVDTPAGTARAGPPRLGWLQSTAHGFGAALAVPAPRATNAAPASGRPPSRIAAPPGHPIGKAPGPSRRA
jgi:hypothetical protein